MSSDSSAQFETLPEDPQETEELNSEGTIDGFELEDEWDNPGGKHRRLLFCFHCHRREYHFHTLRKKSVFPLLIGMTLGMLSVIGPYRCYCCGNHRLFNFDSLHPRTLYEHWRFRKSSRKRRKWK
ncbi:MAG: hypothetical protein R3C03_11770 [Pirellulaceae bacterium]